MSYQLIKEAFVATLVFLGVVLFISLVPFKFEFIKPIKQEFEDFDIYDLFYKGTDKENVGVKDTNIIVVQAAYSRKSIADQIDKIKKLNPSVIGVDLSFADKKEKEADLSLMSSLIDDSSVITGYTLDPKSADKKFIKENFLPPEFYLRNGGYINFSHIDSTSVIRSFAPFFKQDDKIYLAFATRVAQKYSAAKFELLKKRNKQKEFINYYGGLNYYLTYDSAEFDNLYRVNQLGGFKGKIVLLGFFSPNDGSSKLMDDIKFSPLNQKPNGKSFPDTYGVIIHANIISMILSDHHYIKSPSIWVSYLISFCICFFINCLSLYLYRKYTHPSHLLFFALHVVLIIFLVYFFLKLFDWFSLRIDLLPIILIIVVSVEMFELYKRVAVFLNKKWRFKTIFSKHH